MTNAIQTIIQSQFGKSASDIAKFENVPNNSVYAVTVDGKKYIFKLFRGKYWPENGKPQLVCRLLSEHQVPCAELITFTRDDPAFPNGYLIESVIEGTTADKIAFTLDDEIAFYQKLAPLITKIHSIPVGGYGYMATGRGCSDSMCDFFEDEFDERAEHLIENGIFSESETKAMKQTLLNTLKEFEDLPSVLCHGDLSKKNVIVQADGSLVLIDWDDAMAYNWMADLSRFTLWMKMNYDKETYPIIKKSFLDSYQGERKDEFDRFEKAFHLYIATDFLSYAIKVGNDSMKTFAKEYLDELQYRSRL